jgi:hypothetical protein
VHNKLLVACEFITCGVFSATSFTLLVFVTGYLFSCSDVFFAFLVLVWQGLYECVACLDARIEV